MLLSISNTSLPISQSTGSLLACLDFCPELYSMSVRHKVPSITQYTGRLLAQVMWRRLLQGPLLCGLHNLGQCDPKTENHVFRACTRQVANATGETVQKAKCLESGASEFHPEGSHGGGRSHVYYHPNAAGVVSSSLGLN